MHMKLKELVYIQSFVLYSRLFASQRGYLRTRVHFFMSVFNVHSLTYSLDQHPLIHDIHFPPVDARCVLGSGNTGSRGTVVN